MPVQPAGTRPAVHALAAARLVLAATALGRGGGSDRAARQVASVLLAREAGDAGVRLGGLLDLATAGLSLVGLIHPGRRTAAVRDAGLAGALGAAALLAARTPPSAPRAPATPVPATAVPPPVTDRIDEDLPRVASAEPRLWPRPRDPSEPVVVGHVEHRQVRLSGGVMDGAQVVLDPEQVCYEVEDADKGRLRYVTAGLPGVLVLDGTSPGIGEDAARTKD